MKTKVAIVQCNSYNQDEVDRAIETAIDLLDGFGPIIHPQNKVLLKPNLLAASPPEKGIITHPSIVRSVVKLVKQTGAIPIIGDASSHGPQGTVRALEESGINKIAQEEGAQALAFEYSGFSPVSIPGGKQIQRVMLANAIRQAEVVISLAKLKTHMLTMFTGAVKNLFGCTSTYERMKIHGFVRLEDFSQALVDLYSVIKPQLSIIDGIVAMEGNGPNTGYLKNLNIIIASYDGVAADAVAAEICGFAEEEIVTTRLADQQGLGCGRLSEIQILGAGIEEVRCAQFKKPDTYGKIGARLGYIFLKGLFKIGLKKIYYHRPEIDQTRCKKCKICLEHCPVAAIQMKEYPEIDYGKCIECFTCQELCPQGAIKIKTSLIARLIS